MMDSTAAIARSNNIEKWALLAIYSATMFGASAYLALAEPNLPALQSQIVVGSIMFVFAVWWSFADARSKAKRLYGYEILLMLLVPPAGFVLYLFRTHKVVFAVFWLLIVSITTFGAVAGGYYGSIYFADYM